VRTAAAISVGATQRRCHVAERILPGLNGPELAFPKVRVVGEDVEIAERADHDQQPHEEQHNDVHNVARQRACEITETETSEAYVFTYCTLLRSGLHKPVENPVEHALLQLLLGFRKLSIVRRGSVDRVIIFFLSVLS